MPGLAETLAQRLNIETEIIDPFRKIDYNKKKLTPEEIKAIGSIAAVAVGLALRRIGDK
jgi:type IV pilus assembly protein PilM